jgi:hypothetical protein
MPLVRIQLSGGIDPTTQIYFLFASLFKKQVLLRTPFHLQPERKTIVYLADSCHVGKVFF